MEKSLKECRKFIQKSCENYHIYKLFYALEETVGKIVIIETNQIRI
jgi:hypothetical protein